SNGWYVSDIVIEAIATDATSGISEIKYRIDDEWIDYTEPFSLSDGIYSIEIYAKDAAGNEANVTFEAKVDKTKPTASHVLQGTIEDGKYTTDVTVVLSASDNLAGVKEIHYRVDGGNWQIFSGASGSDTIATEGDHTIEYYAVDNAGNVGATHSATFTIEKNKKPVADFSYSPSQPTDLDTITFADASTDEDGSIVAWLWEFGDGTTSNEQNPSHKYADNGTYVVKLTVTDDKGATATVQKIIEVTNVAPVAKFTYKPDKPKVREEIEFNSSLSFDDDGNIVNYTWDFGDGNISYEANPVHVYEKAGTYNVTLTVTDNDGATHTTTLSVTVTEEKINVWLYLIVIVVLIIIAAIVVAIWKKRTKS
ncbi:MAG: PKD domain-containing protein, partial [Thermoplasmata archaeon]|nr:PKD domain-containing protein [Thermoplasmata archaeon]